MTYSAAPGYGSNIFLCDLNGDNQKRMNSDTSNKAYIFELTATEIAAYNSGFYVGNWVSADITVSSVIYEANE